MPTPSVTSTWPRFGPRTRSRSRTRTTTSASGCAAWWPMGPPGWPWRRRAGRPGEGVPRTPAAEVVGFMRLDGFELDQLYIRPGWWGRGIGSRLIEHAKAQSPDGLTLWTFQVNERARGFYAHHGFIELLRTDGSGNEERQPDVRLGWRPPMRGSQSWDAVYAGSPPWDIGRPQSAFRALAEAGALRGRVLDVGCGTGEHTLMAAALGLDATGVDIAPTALAIARAQGRASAASRRGSWPGMRPTWRRSASAGRPSSTVASSTSSTTPTEPATSPRWRPRSSLAVATTCSSSATGSRRHARAAADQPGGDPGVVRGRLVDPGHRAGHPGDERRLLRRSRCRGWCASGASAGPHGAQAWLAVIERVAG